MPDPTTKKTINAVAAFNGDPIVPSMKLNPEDRAYWNDFTDFIQSKGLSGSAELDKRDTNLSRTLFDEFNKKNGAVYKYDQYVPAIQKEISEYRNTLIDNVKQGRIKVANEDGSIYSGDINAYDFDKNYMPGLSNVDGWAGSKTTAFKFPGVKPSGSEVSPQRYNELYKNSLTKGK